MPFWSRNKEEPSAGKSQDFSDELSSFSDNNFSPSSSLGGGEDTLMSQATGLGDLQEFSLALRQQIMVQTVINSLTDKAFEKCITGKPGGDGLTGKEVACVNATVCKWLDTNEFMNGRMARKMGGGGQM
ncbi:hypothetical protein HJC23_000889 [Cyclotella cryptica]|uniref:Mitochondrial import inner membrane translocase subunit n=1 Tax=Cyclotella cryptica TaxID=29204 RepID=A0ABD3PU40_9STRA|eukprot:CCRYP_011609-RA/>CCRYP_011609-RA protein AED:0.47 eAED:0.47 QI:0/-1/0/1/-1/1/1/0/128